MKSESAKRTARWKALPMAYICVILVVWAAICTSSHGYVTGGRPLPQDILHYEHLAYTTREVRAQHERIRDAREAPASPERRVQLTFEAFGRQFTLLLQPSRQPFSQSVTFRVDGQASSHYDPATFYQGRLLDDPGSKVSGHIVRGVFDGVISTSDGEQYHLERSDKFTHGSKNHHTIIYRDSDIKFQHEPGSCAAKDDIYKKMQQLQASAKPITPKLQNPEALADQVKLSKRDSTFSDQFLPGAGGRQRRRRANTVSGGQYCHVLVAADHLFHSQIGQNNPERTVTEIVNVFSQVQDIYRTANFDQDSADTPDAIEPLIARIDILTTATEGYRFSSSNIAVNDYLDLWSQEQHNDFCLALLLTYRDFASGVLGLAWVAQPPGGNRGGVCEDRVQLSVGDRNLNTAIVTFLNYGTEQPRPVSVITVAHEFGHNFGSPHDPGSCTPGGSSGNYIMYSRATDGTQGNNKRFSPCSLGSIHGVLTTKTDCFSDTGAFCGNGLLEDGEDCDCGESETVCADTCCEPGCVLKTGAICSDLQPCCDNCAYAAEGGQCQEETECGLAQNCTGLNGDCPPAPQKADAILCNDDMNVCVGGECLGSICKAEDLEDCQCTGEGLLCALCCVDPRDNTCRTSAFLVAENQLPAGSAQNRAPGRSCDNFNGYCDSQNPPVCIVVDNEQTLNDLLDVFSEENLDSIVDWFITYWYVLIIVFVAILVVLFLLQVTYRRRQPIKKGIRRMRTSIRRGSRDAQGGVAGRRADEGSGQERGGRRRGPGQLSQREALNRLRGFFPTVDGGTLLDVMRQSGEEGRAVRRLLDLGYPLKEVPIPRA